MSISINIKNQGKVYPLQLSLDDQFITLKQLIFQETRIPIERQKILIRGQLSDDSPISSLNLKPNQSIMVLGSPELNLPSAPVDNNGSDNENEEENLIKPPIGIQNLGNTCYLNSTIQLLFNIPIVKKLILNSDKLGEIGSDEHLVLQMKRVFQVMEEKKSSTCYPKDLINSIRYKYSQFNERGEHGYFKQQDAEELFTQLLSSLKNVLGESFISNFQISYKAKIKNLENFDEHDEKFEQEEKLKCHISNRTNFLKTGLLESLTETIEKNSTTLNKNCEFEIKRSITKLPKVLTVQFVRFFWKANTRQKSKILRKVDFPFQLDLADFLDDTVDANNESYRSEKIKVRDELRTIEKEYEAKIHEFRRSSKLKPQTLKAKETFLSNLNQEYLLKYQTKFPTNLSQGENPSSMYTLKGVITHKGLSSDSGHYQAFIRDSVDETKWWKFNDDTVSIVDTERIESLAGGGQSDSALILIYSGFGLE